MSEPKTYVSELMLRARVAAAGGVPPGGTACDRCTGDCCRLFTLPFSPAELERRMLDVQADIDAGGISADRACDTIQMATMAAFVGEVTPDQHTRHAALEPDFPWAEHKTEPTYWYTCRNLLPNGNCGIYAVRPAVCRTYPNKGQCLYAGCTWQAARSGPGAGECVGAREFAEREYRRELARMDEAASWR